MACWILWYDTLAWLEVTLCMLCRLVRRQEETRAQRGQMKQLKGLMHGLVNVTGDPEKQQLDAIRNARQLAFLITDLQDSTAMASANAAAFRKVQDIHDTVSWLFTVLVILTCLLYLPTYSWFAVHLSWGCVWLLYGVDMN